MNLMEVNRKKILITVSLLIIALAPLFLSDFRLNLLAKFLTFCIVAIAWTLSGDLEECSVSAMVFSLA